MIERENMNDKKMHEILYYIDNRIQQKIYLKELAEIAGYSPFYFSKIFSTIMGVSVTSYIRIRKLQFSIIDLSAGNKVVDVALKYSFESHEGFTRSFTKLFGSTPKVVRKYLQMCGVPAYAVPQINQMEVNDMEMRRDLRDDMHQIAFEFIEQSLLEVKEGFCNQIKIELLQDNMIKISDNGRGINLVSDDSENQKKLNSLFAGYPITNLEYDKIDHFKNLGLQTVSSLCEELSIIVYKGGKMFQQKYIRGVAQNDMICSESELRTGMEITIIPDKDIYGELLFSKEYIMQWIANKVDTKYASLITIV